MTLRSTRLTPEQEKKIRVYADTYSDPKDAPYNMTSSLLDEIDALREALRLIDYNCNSCMGIVRNDDVFINLITRPKNFIRKVLEGQEFEKDVLCE